VLAHQLQWRGFLLQTCSRLAEVVPGCNHFVGDKDRRSWWEHSLGDIGGLQHRIVLPVVVRMGSLVGGQDKGYMGRLDGLVQVQL
jgi:hypothetical protein